MLENENWKNQTNVQLCSSQVDKGKSDRFSRMWYWLVLDGTGSLEGGTGWYLMVLGQYGAVLVDT